MTDEGQKRGKGSWVIWLAGLSGCVGGQYVTNDIGPLAGAIMIAGSLFVAILILVVVSVRRLRAAGHTSSSGEVR